MARYLIRPRKSWRAKRPRPRTRQAATSVRELFIHWPGSQPSSWRHVNTEAEERATMRSIQAFHMGPERGFADFAYSFAVFPSGRIYRGRGMDWVPAGQEGHNTNTVAVCVFLGPDDTVPDRVKSSLKQLVRFCERRADHELRVRAHGDVNSTECPGPRLRAIVAEVNRV